MGETTKYILKLLDIYGNYWIYLEITGYIWKLLDISINYWIHREITVYIHILLDISGHIWIGQTVPGLRDLGRGENKGIHISGKDYIVLYYDLYLYCVD